MPRKVIQPKTLNDPRPRYSQGILNSGGKLLFLAGQTASDKDGNVVGKGDIRAQTEQVFANLKAYNEVRRGQYKKTPPTSTLVIVKGLAHPDYLIEIAGIAVL
ncbi:MAG: RidA family protein [Deltaproteobacteria bacterium]|nr:RidA family protein [Deltaproteobacteria bacterium]